MNKQNRLHTLLIIGICILMAFSMPALATPGNEISPVQTLSTLTADPGDTIIVNVVMTLNDPVTALTLDAEVPEDWQVSWTNDYLGATYKESTHEWIWSAEFPAGLVRQITYQLTIPSTATGGVYTIGGNSSGYNISPIAMTGQTELTVTGSTVPAPVADFETNTTSGEVPLDVQFTDLSTDATGWAWDFDNDGVTDSTVQNPQYTYDVPGTYTVSLTVTNEAGDDIETKTDYIVASAPLIMPEADFEADITYGDAPLTVYFTDLSSNADSWEWDINGDGLTDTTLQNANITYNTPGTYNISLTVSNANGTDTETKTNYITVINNPQQIITQRTITPTTVNPGDEVEVVVSLITNRTPSLTALTLDEDVPEGWQVSWTDDYLGATYKPSTNEWIWASSFPPGVPRIITYTVLIPDNATRGTYTISGSASGYQVDPITIDGQEQVTVEVPPTADFEADVTSGDAPLTVQFTDLSSNADTREWDFDNDGVTDSTEQDPEYTYSVAGVYTVSLTVANPDGSDEEVKLGYISVTNAPVPPIADFTADVTEGKVPLTVNFTDSSSHADTWAWDFDNDGVTDSTAQNPQHTYTDAGIYTVTLTVTNEDGSDTMTRTDYVTVNPLVPPVAEFTSDVNDGKEPLTVNFTDLSENATAWAWDFEDDGVTDSTAQNPQHTYNDAGVYAVTLTVTNEDGSDTMTKLEFITVYELVPPVADFTADVTEGKVPLTVNFTDSSSHADTWAWDFDNDGVTDSTAQNPQYTYDVPGTYTVTLTVTNEDGSDSMTRTDYITVNALVPPVADFTSDVNDGKEPLTVNFTDLSENATAWAWDFEDDGVTDSTAQNPQHTYNDAGVYAVTLTVTNEDGSDTMTKLEFITVYELVPPVADFTADVTEGKVPLTVSFTDQSDFADTWAWDFDNDGVTDSTTQDPQYTYTTPGVYAVTLTVTNEDGSDTMTKLKFITVSELVPPVADFTADVTEGKVPLTVNFTDHSDFADTWAWDFDNDGVTDSTAQNPQHTYDVPGTYTVTLTVTNEDGSDAMTRTDYVTVNPLVPPVADFTSDVNDGKEPLTVNFTDLSENATAWAWDFEDDGVTDSTAQNPQHTYTTPGVYAVTLTVTNEDGSDTMTKLEFITVYELVPPVADFTADVTEGKVPLTVNFTDHSDFADTWAWDFDNDGVTDSTAQNPQHTYTDAETYTVTLTVTNEDGSDAMTRTDYVTVNPLVPPVADFTSDVNDGKEPLTVNFTDLSENATAWAWDFEDDGVTDSTIQNPQHTYTTPGVYAVTLTVTNEDGSDTMTKLEFITVYELVPPIADFTADVTSGDAPLTVQFTDLSSNADTWAWDFDNDGVTDSTQQNPQKIYDASGIYTVSLTVTNEDGSDTMTKAAFITVSTPTPPPVPPVADFTSDMTSGDAPLTVQFTDLSSHATGWQWDLNGDGVLDSVAQNPQYTYDVAGTYNVSLTATNDDGTDTMTRVAYITVSDPTPPPMPPEADFTADVTSGNAPLAVQFSDMSSNAETWEWDFNDDGVTDSTLQNPLHTYDMPGSYTVTLTVTGNNGVDSITKTGYITAYDPTQQVPEFPTIALPMLAILGLAFVMQRRKD